MRGRTDRYQGCAKRRGSHRFRTGSTSSRIDTEIVTPVKMSQRECTPKYTRDTQMDTHQSVASIRAGSSDTCGMWHK